MLVVRQLNQQDIPQAHRLVTDNLNELYDPALLAELANTWPAGSIVAEEMGYIMAYLLAVQPSIFEARVLLFVVEPRLRGRGIGTAMMGQLMNSCALKGLKSIYLEVRISNLAGIRFYTKFGFYTEGILPRYYKEGEDAYLMRKNL